MTMNREEITNNVGYAQEKANLEYIKYRQEHGVNDPYMITEIDEAFDAGYDKGYQYAVEKAFDILSQMLYTKRDDEHPAQHYTRSVESMGEFVSQTDFLNQFKQKMQ